MYNGGIRGKRAGDGFGTLSARDQFNQSVLQIPALTGWQPTDGSYNILTGQNAVAPGAIVVVYGTCLLYTSPSPRDRTRSRMPSSA